jgi:hypothetical protein
MLLLLLLLLMFLGLLGAWRRLQQQWLYICCTPVTRLQTATKQRHSPKSTSPPSSRSNMDARAAAAGAAAAAATGTTLSSSNSCNSISSSTTLAACAHLLPHDHQRAQLTVGDAGTTGTLDICAREKM